MKTTRRGFLGLALAAPLLKFAPNVSLPAAVATSVPGLKSYRIVFPDGLVCAFQGFIGSAVDPRTVKFVTDQGDVMVRVSGQMAFTEAPIPRVRQRARGTILEANGREFEVSDIGSPIGSSESFWREGGFEIEDGSDHPMFKSEEEE